jgi:3-isopropylmalate/(R)-2-methylmalate dehydratase small subunit
MSPFLTVTAPAAAMPAANIDTDVIMPKQFLKGIDRSGLAKGTFHDLRFNELGAERPDFVLNKSPWRNAQFLVVGSNFGCGSSREHAVWGLSQLGIRALIGTSFAGIFFDNCARNGLLAITLESSAIEGLMDIVSREDSRELRVDLPTQTITSSDEHVISFEIDPIRKKALLSGLDSIGQTLEYRDTINAFEKFYFAENSWLS